MDIFKLRDRLIADPPATGKDSDLTGHILVPISFCRECGEDYPAVTETSDQGASRYAKRPDNDASSPNGGSGYVYTSDGQTRPEILVPALTGGRVPYSRTKPIFLNPVPADVSAPLETRAPERRRLLAEAFPASGPLPHPHEQSSSNEIAKLAKHFKKILQLYDAMAAPTRIGRRC